MLPRIPGGDYQRHREGPIVLAGTQARGGVSHKRRHRTSVRARVCVCVCALVECVYVCACVPACMVAVVAVVVCGNSRISSRAVDVCS